MTKVIHNLFLPDSWKVSGKNYVIPKSNFLGNQEKPFQILNQWNFLDILICIKALTCIATQEYSYSPVSGLPLQKKDKKEWTEVFYLKNTAEQAEEHLYFTTHFLLY
jgi:hypothetical protein